MRIPGHSAQWNAAVPQANSMVVYFYMPPDICHSSEEILYKDN